MARRLAAAALLLAGLRPGAEGIASVKKQAEDLNKPLLPNFVHKAAPAPSPAEEEREPEVARAEQLKRDLAKNSGALESGKGALGAAFAPLKKLYDASGLPSKPDVTEPAPKEAGALTAKPQKPGFGWLWPQLEYPDGRPWWQKTDGRPIWIPSPPETHNPHLWPPFRSRTWTHGWPTRKDPNLPVIAFPVLNGRLSEEAQLKLLNAVHMAQNDTLTGNEAQEFLDGILATVSQATMTANESKAFVYTTITALRNVTLTKEQSEVMLNTTLKIMNQVPPMGPLYAQVFLNMSLMGVPYQKLTAAQAKAFLNITFKIAPRQNATDFENNAFLDATFAATRSAFKTWTPASLVYVTLKGIASSLPDSKSEVESILPILPPPVESHNYFKDDDAPPEYYWSGRSGNEMQSGSTKYFAPTRLELGPTWSWRERFGDVTRAAPLIDGDRNIYLTTYYGWIFKFDENGQVKWKNKMYNILPGVPALGQGALYTADIMGRVYCINPATGHVFWFSDIGISIAADVWATAVAENVVIVPSSKDAVTNTELVALDANNGTHLWRYKPDHILANAVVEIRNGSVVFADNQGQIYRLNLTTGAKIWKVPPGGKDYHDVRPVSASTTGAVIGPDDVIYATSTAYGGMTLGSELKYYLTAFSFVSGARKWRKELAHEASGAPAVGQLGKVPYNQLAVVVGLSPIGQGWYKSHSHPAYTPKILAMNAHTGDEIWKFELPVTAGYKVVMARNCVTRAFGNPIIGGDGTVYIGYQNGYIYAVNDRDHNQEISVVRGEVSSYNTGSGFLGSAAIAPGMLVATPCSGLHVFKPPSA